MYLHMIASHHGKTEWGALAEPAFPEAAIIHCLDMIDSRMEIYRETLDSLQDGEVSGRVFALDKRVYRHG